MGSPGISNETISPIEGLSASSPSMSEETVALSAYHILSAIRRIWRRNGLLGTVVGSLSRNPWEVQEGTGAPSNQMTG
jgi:hypothetical protein